MTGSIKLTATDGSTGRSGSHGTPGKGGKDGNGRQDRYDTRDKKWIREGSKGWTGEITVEVKTHAADGKAATSLSDKGWTRAEENRRLKKILKDNENKIFNCEEIKNMSDSNEFYAKISYYIELISRRKAGKYP